jgi:hypothetical protein
VALGKHELVASVILVLILSGLVGWWPRDEPPATALPATQTAAQRPTAPLESEASPKPAVQSVASSPSGAGRAGEVDVCGLGYLPATTRLDQLSPKSRAQLDQTSTDLIERLQHSGSVRARSASLLLRVIVTLEDERSASADAVYAACREGSNANVKHETGSPCNLAQSADAQLTVRYVDKVTPYVTELAAMASTSEDPAVYAQAIQACARLPSQNQPPACGTTISLEQWARLEPGNMLPWLRLVGERTQSAATEALFRASLGAFVEDYQGLAAIELSRFAQSDIDQLLALQLSTKVLINWALPEYGALIKMCSTATVADANRRQVCDRTANILVSSADNVLAAVIGLKMGEALGWDRQSVEERRKEAQSLNAILYGDQPDETVAHFDCNQVKGKLRQIIEIAHKGEWMAGKALKSRRAQ